MRQHPRSIAAKAVLSLAAVTLLGTLAIPAEAAGKAKPKHAQRTLASPARPQQPAKAQPVETMDDIRANDQDPAGNYKNFPSWARAAFTNFPRD